MPNMHTSYVVVQDCSMGPGGPEVLLARTMLTKYYAYAYSLLESVHGIHIEFHSTIRTCLTNQRQWKLYETARKAETCGFF